MKFVRILLAAALLLVCACARQPALPDVSPEQADQTWAQFMARTAPIEPYRINISLRYGREDATQRVTALLWSNGSGPVRLDVMAGMGPLVARIREDGPNFVALSPRENKAWVHQSTDPYSVTPRVLINLGVPLPFALTHVSHLLRGNFVEVFGVERQGAAVQVKDGIRYRLAGYPGGTLELSPEGVPLRWADTAGAWVMELGYADADPTVPQKLTLTHADGNAAIVLVKNREKPAAPYTEKQLALEVPAGAEVKDVRREK